MPYMPMVGKNPIDILSYYLQVSSVHAFASGQTSLESTSLVLGYGLDLFFSPVRPAKAYDILGDGFNHFVLYATIAIVVVGMIFTEILKRRKVLHDRWK